MARMPGAVWQPLAADYASQPRMTGHDVIVIHTMVGGLEGTDNQFRVVNGPGYVGTESHYGTSYDGRKIQWQDTAFAAEANFNGNPYCISIENADFGTGFPKWSGSDVPAFRPAQIEAIAEILAWECSRAAHAACPPSWACHQVGIPLLLIPDSKRGQRGIAPHRWGVPGYMVAGGVQWSTARLKACPGDRRIAQIPQIIARARQITNGEDDMAGEGTEILQTLKGGDPKMDRLDHIYYDHLNAIGKLSGQLAAQTVTLGALAKLVAEQNGLTLADVQKVIDDALEKGVDVRVTVTAPGDDPAAGQ